MINIIKNKLRAAGQRDPMVMAVDACEEKIEEKKSDAEKKTPGFNDKGRGGTSGEISNEPKALQLYRHARDTANTVAGGVQAFTTLGKNMSILKTADARAEKLRRNPKGLERIATGFADKLTKDKYDFDKKGPSKMKEEVVNEDEKKKIETMIKTKKMNGKDLTPEQLQGLVAGLTQGGNPSVLNPPKKKKEIKPSGEKKKDTAPKYNPYGTGTANPENMSGSTGP